MGSLAFPVDGEGFDGVPVDEAGVEQLKGQVAHAVGHGEALLQSLHTNRGAVYDPVVGEVSEQYGFRSGDDIRHIIADTDGLAENRVGAAVPQIVPGVILQLAKSQGGAVVHQPDGVGAVLRFHGEEQVDDGIIGEFRGGDAGLGSLGIVEQSERLVRAAAVDERLVFRSREGLAHALGDILLKVEVGIKGELLAQLEKTGDLVGADTETGEIVLHVKAGDGCALRHESSIVIRIGCPDHGAARVLLQIGREGADDALAGDHFAKVGVSGSRGEICARGAVQGVPQSDLGVGLETHGVPEVSVIFLCGSNGPDLVDGFHGSLSPFDSFVTACTLVQTVGDGIQRQTAQTQLVMALRTFDIVFQRIGEPGRLTGAETVAVIGPVPVALDEVIG